MEENENVNENEVIEVNEEKEIANLDEISLDISENDGIKISDNVVSDIAGVAVSEVPGVAGMAGRITEVFSGKSSLSKGIKVDVGEKDTKIDVNIIVEYGVRIPDIAFEIQTRVKKAVETMTGLKVLEVNVHIQGVNFTKEDKAKSSATQKEVKEQEEISKNSNKELDK